MSDLETTETVQAAPVDVNELRAEIQADKVLLADKERTLTAAELVQAEGTHAELLARCDEAQRSLDELEKKVSAQQSAFARAQSRVTNAREGVIVHRSNVPHATETAPLGKRGARSLRAWKAKNKTQTRNMEKLFPR